ADLIRPTAIRIGAVCAEGRDFDGRPEVADKHDAELRPDRVGPLEEGGDPLRCGIGGHIVVGWVKAEQFVTNAAAGEPGDVARLLKVRGDIARSRSGSQCITSNGHAGVYSRTMAGPS